MGHRPVSAALSGHARIWLALAILLAAWAMASGKALAHAELQNSTPANGATVQEGLTQISLTFGDELGVDQSSADLMGPSGAVAGASASVNRAERTKMTITTPALSPGKYTVNWRAFSEDDNNLATGTFSFTVASAGGGASAPPDSTSGSSLPQAGAGEQGALMAATLATALLFLALGVGVLRRVRVRPKA